VNDVRPGISVIIVSWNVRDLLRDAIASVFSCCVSDSYWLEVIVVDNASADGSAEMVRSEFPDVKLIASGENLGFAQGCNLAYGEARGDYLFLLNPDARLISDSLAFALQAMRDDPRLGALGFRTVDDEGEFRRDAGGYFPSIANMLVNYLFLNRLIPMAWQPKPQFIMGDPEEDLDVDWISGAGLFLRGEALGGRLFDPEIFMYGEDMDLCQNLLKRGWAIRYTPRQTIVHHLGQSFEKLDNLELSTSIHAGPRYFLKKHAGPGHVLAFDVILLVGYLIRWPLFSLLALLIPSSNFPQRAAFAKKYLRVVLACMFRGK
jgi:GT2 family glycosyltransferase